MTIPGGKFCKQCATVLGLFSVLGTPALAQEAGNGGLIASLRYGLDLRSDEDGTSARNRLGFSISSITRRERFEFDIDGFYDAALSSGETSDFDNANARLLYRLESRAALFEFDASFRVSDLEDAVVLDEDELALVVEDGQREDYRVGTRLEWGRDSAFGGVFNLDYSERKYLDTSSPLLFDQETLNASLRFNFEIEERITAFTRLSYRDIDRDGGTDSERLSFGVGVDLEITPTLLGEFEIGASRTEESGPDADPDEDGVTFDASLVQTLPNGELSGTFSSDIGENGRRTTFRLRRDVALKDGSLNASIGYGRNAGDDRILLGLGYVRSNPRGSLSLAFNQDFGSTSGGSAVLSSSLRVNMRQQLTTRTGYSFGLTVRDSDPIDVSVNGTQLLSISFTMDHTLTDQWSLVGGYVHTRRKTDGSATTTDDEIFVGISSEFSWRP